jgi:hypothetical protein
MLNFLIPDLPERWMKMPVLFVNPVKSEKVPDFTANLEKERGGKHGFRESIYPI